MKDKEKQETGTNLYFFIGCLESGSIFNLTEPIMLLLLLILHLLFNIEAVSVFNNVSLPPLPKAAFDALFKPLIYLESQFDGLKSPDFGFYLHHNVHRGYI